jgi:hypothetical protein
MLTPFATEHRIEPATALTLLRAGLDSGGITVAQRRDPDGQIRAHVAELQRLESALAGLARHRGTICALSIESGAYTRPDMRAILCLSTWESPRPSPGRASVTPGIDVQAAPDSTRGRPPFTSRPLLARMFHSQDRHCFIAHAVKHNLGAVNDHFAGATDAPGAVQRRALTQAVHLARIFCTSSTAASGLSRPM